LEPDDYLRFALDPGRLAVLGLLAAADRTLYDLIAATGQRSRVILGVLGTLRQAGLVHEDGGAYRLDHHALRGIAAQLTHAPEPDERVLYGMTDDEQAVLGRFFRGSRLTEIPVARSKRRIILERLALEFEPGVYYPEAEVNDLLASFHADYAALRRHLVDEGLLTRERGRYWRSGGRIV
jgi:hypothetical protein